MTLLISETNQHITKLTINRPERRNALNAALISLLLAHLDKAEADPDVRVVIVQGAGEKAFCAGADLGGGVGGHGTADYATLLKKLVKFSKPTIAKVQGYCLAGGMGLMLGCDIVVASENAQFGTPEVNVGLWPMMIGALIWRNMLPKHAAPMVLLGERFSAQQAYEMGMVSQVVAADQLETAVGEMAQKLSQKSPIGIKIGKEAFYQMQGMPLEEALDYLSGQLSRVAATQDAAEGIAAFMEKRPPRFKGQ